MSIRLGETLHAIERRLTKIETRLGQIGDVASAQGNPTEPPKQRVPRTKRPATKPAHKSDTTPEKGADPK